MSDLNKALTTKDIDKIIQNKPSISDSTSEKDIINNFFTNYIRRSKESGAIYFIEWKNLIAQDKEYGEFHRKNLEEAKKFSEKALRAHPAIKYVSFLKGNETVWFSETGNINTARKHMIKASGGKGRIDPLILIKGSCGCYIYKYLEFRRKCVDIKNHNVFRTLRKSAKRSFPDKDAYYVVRFKARFKVRIMPQIESYAGSVPGDVLFEIRERCQENG